ncbi:MAG: PqiB family protein [Candidatus Deferrimicrobiaceae bacterium]
MTEHTDITNVPQAESVPERKGRLSAVWIIPIVAALVGIGIAVQRILSEGPTIRITFESGEGIEAGKTAIKYKEVHIGTVTKVNLTDNHSRILVAAKMEKSAEGMLDNDARFWIVKPRISLSGISGLATLFSGNYIGFEPGKSEEKRRDFVGLEAPPPVRRDRPGTEFVLRSDTLGSLGVGSPVSHRRLTVGEVVSHEFSKDGRSMEIRIFVNAPYDRFVTPDTRFWEASGLGVTAGAEGLSVQVESVTALLIGGIAAENPPTGRGGAPAPTNTVFTLFRDRKAAMAPAEAESQRYVLRFRESLSGLSVGAPVQFLGMPIGEVSDVGLEYNKISGDLRSRVVIVTYTYRIMGHLMTRETLALLKDLPREKRQGVTQKLVSEKGLRAQLRAGSLISGQLYVALDYFPDAPKATIDWNQEPPEFPVVPGGVAQLQEKIQSIVAKLDKVPVEEIGNDVKKAVESLDRTLNRVEGETLPEAKKTLEDLRRAIDSADRLLANADNTLLGPDAPAQRELRDALKEIARSARAIRVLADSLERHPEALIRGKNKENP